MPSRSVFCRWVQVACVLLFMRHRPAGSPLTIIQESTTFRSHGTAFRFDFPPPGNPDDTMVRLDVDWDILANLSSSPFSKTLQTDGGELFGYLSAATFLAMGVPDPSLNRYQVNWNTMAAFQFFDPVPFPFPAGHLHIEQELETRIRFRTTRQLDIPWVPVVDTNTSGRSAELINSGFEHSIRENSNPDGPDLFGNPLMPGDYLLTVAVRQVYDGGFSEWISPRSESNGSFHFAWSTATGVSDTNSSLAPASLLGIAGMKLLHRIFRRSSVRSIISEESAPW